MNAGYCYEAGLKQPASKKPCNTAPCPASIAMWAVGLWSACVPRWQESLLHQVYSQSHLSRPLLASCARVLGRIPRFRVCCTTRAFCSSDESGDSSRTCGPGSMTRNVTCVDSSGKQLTASSCQSPQPLSVSDCDLGLCQCSRAEDCLARLQSDGLWHGAASHFECLGGACVCMSG